MSPLEIHLWKRYHHGERRNYSTQMSPSQQNLKQVIYVSSAVGLPLPEEIERLLHVSRKHNEHDAISGLLLYHDGSFMQIIEGSEDAVDALFSRIRMDPLHRNIIKLHEGPTSGRLFPGWSMGFARPDTSKSSDKPSTLSFHDIRNDLAQIQRKDLRVGTLLDSYFRMFRTSYPLLGGFSALQTL